MCATSVVCVGEIRALAEKSGWGSKRRIRLESLLEKFLVLPIKNHEILTAYALIDAWTSGKPVEAPLGTPPLRPARKMGKNDLWIAATAHVTRAALLSTDRDFEHLGDVWFVYHFVDQAEEPT